MPVAVEAVQLDTLCEVAGGPLFVDHLAAVLPRAPHGASAEQIFAHLFAVDDTIHSKYREGQQRGD